jgi:hypothetical protein
VLDSSLGEHLYRMTSTVTTSNLGDQHRPTVFVVDDDTSVRESLEMLNDERGSRARLRAMCLFSATTMISGMAGATPFRVEEFLTLSMTPQIRHLRRRRKGATARRCWRRIGL